MVGEGGGQLEGRVDQPVAMLPQLMSRLKILARLDISDKRRPQDGRFTIESRGRHTTTASPPHR
ncbi:MAG: hypothetical protein OXT09_05240 [Myxococcales bacterium]|nr:hypothetical protein [Myxococcales bacterium]